MRNVIVSIPEVHISYLTLEVDDDDDAQAMKEKANLLLESGDYLDALEYSHTMDMEMWDITEEVCDCDYSGFHVKADEDTSSNEKI